MSQDFKYFQEFNLYLFSKNKDNMPCFLLNKTAKESSYSHLKGKFTEHDPAIFYAVAREFVEKTCGLLSSENFQYFLAENPTKLKDENDLVFEKITENTPVRPQMRFSSIVNDICKHLCESPFIYQDESERVTYFIEFPMMNLEVINGLAKTKEVDIEFTYKSWEEMMGSEVSRETKNSLEDLELQAYIQRYLIENKPIEFHTYYAMVCCEPLATDYMLQSLHYAVFKKHGEHWRFYRAFKGEFPTHEDLQRVRGIIIPGSGQSAYDTNVSWYKELFECIRNIHLVYTHINLLGICFGAQSCAQALGGRVEKMNRSYIRGGEALTTKEPFYELDYVKRLNLNPEKPLVIAESHGDHIAQLPDGAVLQSSSVNTNVEIYTIGNKVLAFQGHPDYNEAWTAGANYRKAGLKIEPQNYDNYALNEYIPQVFPDPVTHKEILSICYSFLKKVDT